MSRDSERLTAEQAALVEDHLVYAERAAAWGRRRWPFADRSDLLSWAYEGLCEAARRHDPARGQFSTGAFYRCRMGIVDGFRRDTKWRRRGRPVVLSIDVAAEASEATYEADAPLWGLRDNDRVRAALAVSESGYLGVELAASIDTLPDRHRELMRRRLGGEPLRAIGDDMGVTESRACQLQREAREALVAAGWDSP